MMSYWTVENLTERLADRSHQLLSARDKIDTLTDEVEYLGQAMLTSSEAAMLEVLAADEVARHTHPPHALVSALAKLREIIVRGQ